MKAAAKRHSKKREAILDLIRSSASHPSAQWLYDELKPRIPGLSLGTVYRNIGFFLREGSVVSVGVVNGEERFDGRLDPHPHCVCGRCGRVFDLPCADAQALEDLARKAGKGARTADFSIDYRRTVFLGVCGGCGESVSF
jgi:Fur family peroxide stress response transcriptional regulator